MKIRSVPRVLRKFNAESKSEVEFQLFLKLRILEHFMTRTSNYAEVCT